MRKGFSNGAATGSARPLRKITTYDTTLRDGEQAQGVTLSLEDKLRIARRLDEFGIDIIEGGFPASNPKDVAFFAELREHPLEHARVAAFGSTCRKGVSAAEDVGLASLVASGAPVVAIAGKTWDEQVTRALQTTLEENLRMIADSVAFLKAQGLEVVFDAEHFFDGYKANPDYALACIRAAAQSGADSIDLCETNGGMLPFEVAEITAAAAAALADGAASGSALSANADAADAAADANAADAVDVVNVTDAAGSAGVNAAGAADAVSTNAVASAVSANAAADPVGASAADPAGVNTAGAANATSTKAATDAAAADADGGDAVSSRVEAARESESRLRNVPRLGIHCHNDSGCAVANTLAAVRAGASQVQGTVNGYGERVGNADLLTVIADLELKMGCTCVGSDRLRDLTGVAAYVAEICNLSVWAHAPYVGASAFAHKGGLHASAIARFPEAYNHVSPDAVGNNAHTLVSELAGRASLAAKAASLGYDLRSRPEKLQEILDDVKAREAAGYSYEVADGSLALLIERHMQRPQPHFTLESFRVIVDDREDTGALAKDAQSEATIKVHVGDERFVATGEGVGPVGALSKALKMALSTAYPQVKDMHLIDFKVRLLDESTGTDAITRVTITTREDEATWGTIGVSENIIEASWNALVESIEYGLSRIDKRNGW